MGICIIFIEEFTTHIPEIAVHWELEGEVGEELWNVTITRQMILSKWTVGRQVARSQDNSSLVLIKVAGEICWF